MLFAIIIIISFSSLFSADWKPISKIVASDRGSDDYFSNDIAISGNFAIVGAYREDRGVDEGGFLLDAGAAYIFRFNGMYWEEMQKLTAPVRNAEDLFGHSVDICGNYAIVGSPQEEEGRAYIFFYNGTSWIEQDKLKSIDFSVGDNFGYSVALSEDRAVIGAVYEDDNVAGTDSVGSAGSAYIFSRSGSTWTQSAKIVATNRVQNDQFGFRVAISGSYVVVSSPYVDYDADSLNYEPQAGAAYVYYHGTSGWQLQQTLVASDRDMSDFFGYSMDIDGSTIVVGAYMEDPNSKEKAGSAYIYMRSGSTWSEQQKIEGSEQWVSDFFGRDVAIDGDYIIVGADGEDHDTLAANYIANAGAAYVFKYFGGVWTEQEKIVAPFRRADDAFGNEVDISNDVVLIGAIGHDLDGDEANLKSGSGAAYVFSTGIGGSVIAEINVQSDGVDIASGDTIPSLEDNTDFGITQITSGRNEKTYNIQNLGTGSLFLGEPILSGTDTSDFSILTSPSDTILAGNSSTFRILFSPSAVGVRKAKVTIANSDADENPYTFAIQGTGIILQPDIYVHVDSIEIVSGDNTPSFIDNTDFGTVYLDSGSITKTYSISNLGLGFLHIDSIFVHDSWGVHFIVSSPAPDSLAPGSSGSFTISFTPNDTTLRLGSVNIESNDPDEAHYQFMIQGRGLQEEVGITDPNIPDNFSLFPAYPNPFNPRTVISMHYAEGGNSTVNIYNLQGKLIDRLINGYVEAGTYELTWDANDMPSGMYIVRMTAGDFIAYRKIILIK